MKRFIINTILFLFPLLLIAFFLECKLRSIPNIYSYKSNYLKNNSDNLEVLFLGSSHALYGLNPDYISLNSFNAAHNSQSLNLDLEIYKRYQNDLKKLKYIVLPVSYFSLNSTLEKSIENWRIKNYIIYLDIDYNVPLKFRYELLANNIEFNRRRLYNAFLNKKEDINCSPKGWGVRGGKKSRFSLEEAGKIAAKRHTNQDKQTYDENITVLNELIALAKLNNIKIILYTPPAYFSYVKHLNSKQLNEVFNLGRKLDSLNANVKYISYLNDSSFIQKDFWDADHLSDFGAKKFSIKMNSEINTFK